MRIRAITLGLDLSADILLADPSLQFIEHRLKYARSTLDGIQTLLETAGYTVQTTRLTFNSFSEWLLPLLPVLALASSDDEASRKSPATIFEELVRKIDQMLIDVGIHFCSFGSVSQAADFPFVAQLIRHSTRISASIALDPSTPSLPHSLLAPDYELCRQAAAVCLNIADIPEDLTQIIASKHDNFRFCVSFQTPKNTPFFPVACHASGRPPTVSLGLENGDLVFLACFAAETFVEARDNLLETLVQTISPIQCLLQRHCDAQQLLYAGVDASMNPGIAPQDSVIFGLEHVLQNLRSKQSEKQTISWPPTAPAHSNHNNNDNNNSSSSSGSKSSSQHFFGSMGSLSAVSAITSALKLLSEQPLRRTTGDSNSSNQDERILTCGYNGLMLPVMEDLTLADRAATLPTAGSSLVTTGISLRDLLVFSCVCGVGLDTVPIPGDSSVDALAAVYSEVGTLSYRLQKALTCRLLPMPGLKAGEWTQVTDNPYLVNTRVFSIE